MRVQNTLLPNGKIARQNIFPWWIVPAEGQFNSPHYDQGTSSKRLEQPLPPWCNCKMLICTFIRTWHVYGSDSPGQGKWPKGGFFYFHFFEDQLLPSGLIFSTFLNCSENWKMPHFDHFSCPGEPDPCICTVKKSTFYINIF